MTFRRLILPLVAGLFLLLASRPASAEGADMAAPLKAARFPSLESAIRIKGPVSFCNEPVPLDLPAVRERLERELLLMLWDRAQVILWLKRSGRYFPHIEAALAEAGLPDDLKYVAVIESALKPHAGSGRGARGVWQFIESTGRNHGLVINRYIDERRNYRLATKAALAYLRTLHEEFGSWTLACAAYNMGEVGLGSRMDAQDADDYYHLDLPTETERYVLRAMAAKLILSDPGRYGFRLEPEDFYGPVPCDRILLKTRQAAPVLVVAKAAGTYYKTVRDMNPQLLDDVIPAGEHVLFLPEGSARGFASRYQSLIVKYRKRAAAKTYTVRRGDTLTAIADKTGTPLTRLLKLNDLGRRSTIRPGQKLVIMQ
ncbi:lytic transglycosylase domain-containing protein [Pseudodesulfovibrio sp.]|uniref:lytic transglycosylase domain-containing protein n=1 Tax=Pseudodesulfovibrio sp. TaxID=2035812 RepID=UPI002612331F|nr:lytic transglycosylase domain-containing protein [Pseudodesulfovibrio sp.]MDD3313874.1 transglycosylase SLT domain-containing protein [Pseudodesulfovibrio sp.]